MTCRTRGASDNNGLCCSRFPHVTLTEFVLLRYREPPAAVPQPSKANCPARVIDKYRNNNQYVARHGYSGCQHVSHPRAHHTLPPRCCRFAWASEYKLVSQHRVHFQGQKGEDAWVLPRFWGNPPKRNGTYIEIGAMDGFRYRYTQLLHRPVPTQRAALAKQHQ